MNKSARITELVPAQPVPSFFNTVLVEAGYIAEHGSALVAKSQELCAIVAAAKAEPVEDRAIALLRRAVEANDTLGFQMQSHVNRIRGQIAQIERKLTAHDRKAVTS